MPTKTLTYILLGKDELSNVARRAGKNVTDENERISRSSRKTADEVESSGKKASEAASGWDRLANAIEKAGKKSSSFSGKASGGGFGGGIMGKVLATAGIATGVGTPLAAGGAVAAGGLAAAAAAGGAGLAAFGVIAQSVYTKASAAATAADSAQTQYNAAVYKADYIYKQQMASATNAAQRKAAASTHAKALMAAEATQAQATAKAYDGMSQPQIKLAKTMLVVKGQWDNFIKANTSGVASIMTQGMGLLPKIFTVLTPFLPPVEKALHGIVTSISRGLDSTRFKAFIDLLARNSGPAITKFSIAIGHIVRGLAGIITAFMPFSQTMVSGIDTITAKFATWGQTLSGHSGFKALVATAKQDAPQVIALLKNVATAVVHLGQAMAGMSTPGNSRQLLSFLVQFSGILSTLTANRTFSVLILYSLALGSAFGKIAGPVSQTVRGFNTVSSAMGKYGKASETAGKFTKIWTGIQAAFNVVMALNPVVLITIAVIAFAAAIYLAWTRSATFRKITEAAFHAVLTAASTVWRWISNNWPLLLAILTGPVGVAAVFIIRHWSMIRNAAASVLNWIPHAAAVAWNAVSSAFTGMWRNVLQPAIRLIGTVFGTVVNAMTRAASTAWRTIGTIFGTLWRNVLRPTIMALWTTFSSVAGFIIHSAAKMFGWVPGVGKNLKGAAHAFDVFRDDVNRSINGVQNKTVHVGVALGAGVYTAAGARANAFTHRATGGRITGPGGPRSDTAGLFALSNKEWVIQASSSEKYGPAAMDAVNRGTAVIQYRAGGGAVNVSPVTPRPRDINNAIWNDVVKYVKANWMSFATTGGALGAYAAGSGVARWAPLILRALAMLGQSAAWLPTVERRMNQESGGNPFVVNRWDSNAMAGHPSMGLMQTIPGTFNAYAGPFRSLGIFNPMANIYAGLNYALHQYHTLAALNRAGGYAFGGMVSFDNGGFLPPRSMTMAVNGTNSYERVGGNGNTYNINITASPLARPGDIGREVVGAIRAFEKDNGAGWRKTP